MATHRTTRRLGRGAGADPSAHACRRRTPVRSGAGRATAQADDHRRTGLWCCRSDSDRPRVGPARRHAMPGDTPARRSGADGAPRPLGDGDAVGQRDIGCRSTHARRYPRRRRRAAATPPPAGEPSRNVARRAVHRPATRPRRVAHRDRSRSWRTRSWREGRRHRPRRSSCSTSRCGSKSCSDKLPGVEVVLTRRGERVRAAAGADRDRQSRRRRSVPVDPRQRQQRAGRARNRDLLPELRIEPERRGSGRPRERHVRSDHGRAAGRREGHCAEQQAGRVARLRHLRAARDARRRCARRTRR